MNRKTKVIIAIILIALPLLGFIGILICQFEITCKFTPSKYFGVERPYVPLMHGLFVFSGVYLLSKISKK